VSSAALLRVDARVVDERSMRPMAFRGKNWNASTINGNAARGHGMLINALHEGRIVWNKVRLIKGSCCEWRSNSPHLWHLKIPQFS
jgi:site-specific DNA recombinase